jgi:hypothetical protein
MTQKLAKDDALDIKLCVRPDNMARLTALVIDLPRNGMSRMTMDLVILSTIMTCKKLWSYCEAMELWTQGCKS